MGNKSRAEDPGRGYIDTLIREVTKVLDYSPLTDKINNTFLKKFINEKTLPFITYAAYKGVREFRTGITDRNTIVITIGSKNNELYTPTLAYLATQTSYLKKKKDEIKVDYEKILTPTSNEGGWFVGNSGLGTSSDSGTNIEDKRVKSLLADMEKSFIPREYCNTIKYKGAEFEITKEDTSAKSTRKSTKLQEDTLEFRINKKHRSELKDFFSEVIKIYYETNLKKGLRVFSSNSWGGWETVTEDLNKSIDGVFIDKEDKDYIINDIDNFLSKKEKLKDKGIPYKRNFLFHGVSGTGKTTLIKALATKYRRDIYFLSMNRNMDNNDFIQTLNEIQSGSFIVIEEVDVLFNQREKNDSKVSFDVFINALDGMVSKEDSIIFMTTNHIEKIDEALMRPGRVDTQLEFKEGEFGHFKAMAEYIFDKALTSKESKQLAKILGLSSTYKHSLIQNFYIKFNTFEEMIQNGDSFEKFKNRYN